MGFYPVGIETKTGGFKLPDRAALEGAVRREAKLSVGFIKTSSDDELLQALYAALERAGEQPLPLPE